MKYKTKTFNEFLSEKKEYFIRSSGKGEMKIYHLIDKIDFNIIDMFFQTKEDAEEYAKKHNLKIVEYGDK